MILGFGFCESCGKLDRLRETTHNGVKYGNNCPTCEIRLKDSLRPRYYYSNGKTNDPELLDGAKHPNTRNDGDPYDSYSVHGVSGYIGYNRDGYFYPKKGSKEGLSRYRELKLKHGPQ